MIKQRRDVTFFIITKRIHRFAECIPDDWGDGYDNVHICCTCENQKAADFRLPIFIKAPIKQKSIICEPLLEQIDLSKYLDKSMIKEELIDNLFHEDCWSLKKEPKKMTKEEIEKALGYEIEINEPKKDEKSKDNQSISKNAQKTQKNVFADDIFDFLFW